MFWSWKLISALSKEQIHLLQSEYSQAYLHIINIIHSSNHTAKHLEGPVKNYCLLGTINTLKKKRLNFP